MESIYKYITELKQSEWDYYTTRGRQITELSLALNKNWNNDTLHFNFIEAYLKIGEKLDVLMKFENNQIRLHNFKRTAHTNSVFFLGCIFYKELKLKDKIKFTRTDKKSQKTIDEFYFIWFLSSLTHDFGYEIENCSFTQNNLSKEITNEIGSFKSFFKIKKDLLTSKYKLEANTKILLEHVSNYFKARKDGKLGRDGSKKIDHGIVAGLLLFDGLVRNREDKEKLNQEKQKNRVETDGLYWGKDLEKFYAIASSTVATHNMRRCNGSNDKLKEIYQKYNLNRLSINGDTENITKLSIDKDPFALLFALADTLEPLKLYENCFERQTILESICIEIKDNEITFENKNSKLNFESFCRNVKSLESWTNVNIEEINDNKIKITLN